MVVWRKNEIEAIGRGLIYTRRGIVRHSRAYSLKTDSLLHSMTVRVCHAAHDEGESSRLVLSHIELVTDFVHIEAVTE